MLNKIKSIFQQSEYKLLLTNFGYLVFLSFANFILPFLSFPYLVRTVGVEKFGLLSFSISIISYFVMITDYSFNLAATREVALSIGDNKKIQEIVSSVYTIKIALTMISFLVLCFLVSIIPKLHEYWFIHLFTFGTVIGQMLFPVWFFQGIEKMKLISVLNVVSKLLFTLCIFIFIRKQEDYFLVPVFSYLGIIIVGIISVLILIIKYKIVFYFPSKKILKVYLKDGWHLFLSNISITLYTSTTTAILGFFTNNTLVGYYSVAEKVISALKGMISPISQTLFPYLSKKSNLSKENVLKINKKLIIYITPLFMTLSMLLFVYAKEILFFLFKRTDSDTILVLKIMSVIPTIIFLHTVFALFTMLVFGRNRDYSKIIISAGIINLAFAFILIPIFQHIGAAICITLLEFYILMRYIYYTENNGLKIIFKDD